MIKENKFYLFLSGFLKKYLSKTVWVHPLGCASPNMLLCIWNIIMKREIIIRNRLFKTGKSEFLSSKNFTKFIKKIRVGTKIKQAFSLFF